MRYILPRGFLASGVHCGIKRFKKDLALLYSKTGCKAVGVFTRNKVKAVPVVITKGILKKGFPIRAVLINSGNANCCTGRAGMRGAKRIIKTLAQHLNLKFHNIVVSSTGIIGKRFPVELIEKALPRLAEALSENGLLSAARAIMTTDKKTKLATERFNLEGREVLITGIAKGAGMIQPDMATMLCFIMTDARIDKLCLKEALKSACERSFNSITVDGDMSTNDCVLLLANGNAGNRTIKIKTKGYRLFLQMLKFVMLKLARAIVEDGEGATKFVTVKVEKAKTTTDAYKVARKIANSNLVKTSIYGGNPNWGRIAACVGSSEIKGLKQNNFEIYLDRICVFRNGKFTNPSKDRFNKIYKKKKVEITVNLNLGRKDTTVWTCDLSKKYVAINAHYMS